MSERPEGRRARQDRPPGQTRPDHGTVERRGHRGGVALEETMRAGLLRARAVHECALDAYRAAGALGEGAAARRRYEAGLWLRRLYLRTHGERLVGNYEGLRRDQSHDQGEISDEQAQAFALYRRTLLALGPEFGVLRLVCCDDRPGRPSLLRRALDRLADWRGL